MDKVLGIILTDSETPYIKISSIFDGSRNLESMALFSSLTNRIFISLEKLTSLSLAHNNITVVPNWVFLV